MLGLVTPPEHGGRSRSRCEGEGRETERENFEFLVKAKLKTTQKGGLSDPQLNESAKLLFIGTQKQNFTLYRPKYFYLFILFLMTFTPKKKKKTLAKVFFFFFNIYKYGKC